MTTSGPAVVTTSGAALRRLYLTRFVFAALWAAVLLLTAPGTGPFLTTLLVVYPLFDAAAVLWQLRTADAPRHRTTAERVNVVVSLLVAVALGWAATASVAAALVVWGAWAVGSGVPQLLAAIRHRRSGGQVAQMLSGGISILAGLGFLSQGFGGAGSIAGVGGYAALGGIFFLVSAIRLGTLQRKAA